MIHIIPEREVYNLFDISLKDKVLKRNSVKFPNDTQLEQINRYAQFDDSFFSAGIYPDLNCVIGKLTGSYRLVLGIFYYEVKLFNHAWVEGNPIFYFNLKIYPGATISALKYYDLLVDDGNIICNVYKDHFSRVPNIQQNDLFPHFDPDYLLFSKPQDWDAYFHVTPADWTGANANKQDYFGWKWRETAPFYGYNYSVSLNKQPMYDSDANWVSNTQRSTNMHFPIFKTSKVIDKGGCVAVGHEPTIADNLSTSFDPPALNYNPMQAYFYNLTPNALHKLRSWVKYLDENDDEQIVYSETFEFMTPADLIRNPLVESSVARFMTNNTTDFYVHVAQKGDLGAIDEAGICLSATNQNPTIADLKFSLPSLAIYNIQILNVTGLLSGTVYYVRTYAKVGETVTYGNTIGSVNGEVYSFRTMGDAKSLATVKLIRIYQKTYNGFSLSAQVTNKGNDAVIERGFCWAITPNPSVLSSKTKGDSESRLELDIYSADITALNPNTVYYVRAYAINSVGVSYSELFTTETLASPGVATKVTLPAVSNITDKSAIVISSANEGINTERGVCFSTTNTNPTTADTKITAGTGLGIFQAKISGLVSNKLYFVRAYVIVGGVTIYSESTSFSTLKAVLLPTIVDFKAQKNASETELVVAFNCDSDGGDTGVRNYVYFGNVMPTSLIPGTAVELSTGEGSKTHTFDLKTKANGVYYVCAYASNSAGTVTTSILQMNISQKSAATISTKVEKLSKTKVTLSATVTNFGGSVTESKSLILKKEGVLFANYDLEFNNLTGAFSKTIELEENKSYEFTFELRTEWMLANAINKVVSTAAFNTTAAVVEDTLTVSLTKTAQNGNVIDLSADYEGISSAAVLSISIVGDRTKQPSYPLGNEVYKSSVTSPFDLHLSVPATGKWYFRAIVTTATGKLFLSNLLELNISSIYDPDDENIQEGAEVFAPPTSGNYDGRPYEFGDRRWIYNGVDGAWRLDYSYKKETLPTAQVAQLRAAPQTAIQEELTYDIFKKLDRIPRVGDKIDGFEVVSVFFSDDSDSDIFPYARFYGLLLVNFEAIELCNYARAKEIADSLSAELMPIRKYPHILSFIYDRIGYSASEELWGDSETEDEASVYYANDDTIEEVFISKTQERRAIPCRILVKDRYVTNLYSRTNEVEISLDWDDVNNQREVGVIERMKLTLKRKSDGAVVSSIESTVQFDDTICISYTELTPSPVKIEYVVKCILYRKPTSPLTHRVWIDSVSFTGGVGIISENDFELLLNTL